MKCDHLIGRTFDGDVYILASDVTEAIAELKEFAEDACLERDDNQTAIDELQAENAELKQKLRDHCIHCPVKEQEDDVVDANMENRRLKRALWIARAERAKTEHLSKIMYSTLYRDFIAKWVNVERKCRAKAEEYK